MNKVFCTAKYNEQSFFANVHGAATDITEYPSKFVGSLIRGHIISFKYRRIQETQGEVDTIGFPLVNQ